LEKIIKLRKYHVIDEILIDKDPETIFRAIESEYLGISRWWIPFMELEVRGEKTLSEGSVIDAKIPLKIGSRKVTFMIVKIVKNQLIGLKYVKGDYLGTGEWILNPQDNKTLVRYSWNGTPNTILARLLININVPQYHSRIYQAGLRGLKKYLSQNNLENN
jgi:hypothetical protein